MRLSEDRNTITDDSIGGRAYYLARAELEIPLGDSVRELGLRPSIFVDVGALWGVRRPALLDIAPGSAAHPQPVHRRRRRRHHRPAHPALPHGQHSDPAAAFPRSARSISPTRQARASSIGFGVNWNSPFGPFRIDIAHALLHEPGDDTKLFTFNVGTAF